MMGGPAKFVTRWQPATQAAWAALLWSLIMLVVVGSFAGSLATDGRRLAVALVFPVVVCLSAVVLSFWRAVGSKIAMWCLVTVLGLFSLVTGFSIGLFYVPAVLALGYAAALNTADA
jgi:hypothetical protein